VSNLPAHQVGYHSGWHGSDYRLEVSGQVRQSSVFGENILLKRRISTSLGSRKICLQDTVTNEGSNAQPHMIMYHINIGFPLLSEAAHLEFDAAETVPEDQISAKGLADWRVFQPPSAGFQEQNFIHTPEVGGLDWASAELKNPDLKLGFRLGFDSHTLPYLNEWKMMGEGLYVLAIEPMNCNPLGGRAAMRARNVLPFLDAGESRSYALEIEVVEYD
jgi:hypothetical protein